MQRTTVTKIFEFAAAHNLPDHAGKCKNVHGHTYKLEVSVSGPVCSSGSSNGMVVDFGELGDFVKRNILDLLDHRDLNEMFLVPTAELMARWIFKTIKDWADIQRLNMVKVRLWESSTSFAEVEEVL